jgi:IS30 family transposase
MIDERPAVVEERSRLGDFEGDLIVGRNGLSAIGTLVDRTTRLVRLLHLPDTGHGEATAAAIIAAVADLPMLARRTFTWDRRTDGPAWPDRPSVPRRR